MTWLPWRRKPPPERHPLPGWPAGAAYADSLSDDLRRHLYEQLFAVASDERMRSQWVMTPEWWIECRKMADSQGVPLWQPAMRFDSPDVLLGILVEVRDGSGPPHLEPAP